MYRAVIVRYQKKEPVFLDEDPLRLRSLCYGLSSRPFQGELQHEIMKLSMNRDLLETQN